MFEIGFFEIILCAVVALIVLGPERLPEALRFLGRIVAKFNRVWQRLSQDLSSKINE